MDINVGDGSMEKMTTAFLFPGQGSQKVGMIHDLYEKYDVVKKLIKEADETLDFKISKLMFEGPEDDLMKTEFTQPAILTASVACWKVLCENGVDPCVVAGHSLGEYSALVAASAISFSDAVHTVNLRGKFMQEAVPLGKGAMAAIIGMDTKRIEEICKSISTDEKPLQAVNYNCPGQVVIAGVTTAVEKACKVFKDEGAKRAIMLKVSAPFHSVLMKPAAIKLKEVLDKIEIKDSFIPIVANVNANVENTAQEIRENLINQTFSPVLWEESVRFMIKNEVTKFIECGPGTVLSGFMRRIDKNVFNCHAENIETINEVINKMKDGE